VKKSQLRQLECFFLKFSEKFKIFKIKIKKIREKLKKGLPFA